MTHTGSPPRRNSVAITAVSTEATQGASVRDRRARIRGSSPSSDSCDSVRAAPVSGVSVPWNMLKTMNQMAAAWAALPNSGATVGPSTSASTDASPLPPIVPAPSTPSHTTGSTRKYSVAIEALAYIARGTFFSGSTVSPTWQAAASKAGAAKPIRYRPAMALVMLPNTPLNGVSRWKDEACTQLTCPVSTGTSAERKASAADPQAITTATRVTTFMPARFKAVNVATMMTASSFTGIHGRYHWWSASADRMAVSPQVGT